MPQKKLLLACKEYENAFKRLAILEEELKTLELVNAMFENLNHKMIDISTVSQLNKFKAYRTQMQNRKNLIK